MSSQAAARSHKDHARNGRASKQHFSTAICAKHSIIREAGNRVYISHGSPKLGFRCHVHRHIHPPLHANIETIRFPLCFPPSNLANRRTAAYIDRGRKKKKFFWPALTFNRVCDFFRAFKLAVFLVRVFLVACFRLRAHACVLYVCVTSCCFVVVRRVRFPVPRGHNRARPTK